MPSRRARPGDALDGEQRWNIVRRLLNDPDVDLADRIAGSFLLLYAQPLSRIAVMTLGSRSPWPRPACRSVSQPPTSPSRVCLARSRDPRGHKPLPPRQHRCDPEQLALSRPPPRTADHRRLSRSTARRVRYLCRAARRGPQQQGAAEVPAVVLAEMLGVAITTAVAWVQAVGGDWANYAALITEENAQC